MLNKLMYMFAFPPGGGVSVTVPLYQSFGQSADAEQSSILAVAPGGPLRSAERAAS